MKQRIPNAIYNKEFREQAVKRVQKEELSAEAVAEQLSMPKSPLAAWVGTSKEGKLSETGKTQHPLTEIQSDDRFKPYYAGCFECAGAEMQRNSTRLNQIWVSDITYIPTDEGWLYLAGHKDWFSGDLAGYAMSGRMTKNLITQSLFRGIAEKRPPKGLIHHPDRGSHNQWLAVAIGRQLSQIASCFINIVHMNTEKYSNDLAWSRRCHVEEIATTTRQWKVLGDCLKMNGSTIAASKLAPRLFKRLLSTSRYFISGNANRLD